MFSALFHYTFLQHAVIAAVLASVACGIMGTIIVTKKLVMMSSGIAHTAFGGIGLGYFLAIEPIIGALFFSVASSLGITALKRNSSVNSDVLMGMFWPLGMALGIIFIALTPGYPPDMTSYLFGDILTVSRQDLTYMLVLDILMIIAVTVFIHWIKAYLFDEEFGTALGLNMAFIDYLIFVLIAITVVTTIRVVGIILILSLLCVPPTIARMFTFDLKIIMFVSTCLGIIFCLAGLWSSYVLQVSSGASIVIVAFLAYLVIWSAKRAVSVKNYG
jgi:zinc transport system permease protein